MARRNKLFLKLFKPPPTHWGLRGDPFLWRAMARTLSRGAFPHDEAQLVTLVEMAFEKLTGFPLPEENSISESDSIYWKRYAYRGISPSKMLSPHFWRTIGLPLLLSRLTEIRKSISSEVAQPVMIRYATDVPSYTMEEFEVEREAAEIRRQRGYEDGLAGRPMQPMEDGCIEERYYQGYWEAEKERRESQTGAKKLD